MAKQAAENLYILGRLLILGGSDMEKLYRLIYPMRVCLITSRHGAKDNVMAASWVFPLSMDPPLFGVSVSEKRFSHRLIREGKAFGINLPHSELEKAVVVCGTESGRDTDKFAKAGLTKDDGVRVPLIKQCPVSIECELVDEIKSGDHVVFVGKAVKVVKRFEAKGIYQARGEGFISV
jgi:flavin reductase (DIM6/NTAB) family NADH-FMN oxidoreductase RutF